MIAQEPAIGTVSDVIRWYQGLLLVYSELPEAGEINPPPADVGLPQLFHSNTIVVNFDENGNGSVQFAGAVSVLPSLGNIVDPFDPGSGIKPLAYNLSAVIGLVPVMPFFFKQKTAYEMRT